MTTIASEHRSLFICPGCGVALTWSEAEVHCGGCGSSFAIRDSIPRFVQDHPHANFSIQWKRFSSIQLDSRNGTSCSRDRLLAQSHLEPSQFQGKTILEVGCGAGRFTEIFLDFGANVIATDFSEAVEACAESHAAACDAGKLSTAQADVFALPFPRQRFEIVVGYGMLQHTGDAERALACLWDRVAPGGLLLVDRYQWSLRATHPYKYLIRPFLKHMSPMRVLSLAEATCSFLIPAQRRVLRLLQGPGVRRYLRQIANRMPNSVFPLNLEISGGLSPETAFQWSVLDTFDMWAPRYDDPQTFSSWKKSLEALPGGEVLVCESGGQGNHGVVRRVP